MKMSVWVSAGRKNRRHSAYCLFETGIKRTQEVDSYEDLDKKIAGHIRGSA
jgi:hypothetical protein